MSRENSMVPECRWDPLVSGEAHKMSAPFIGGEVKFTKPYHLGRLLSGLTRHFLGMTATPHHGMKEDFQLFLALVDGDRFEGRFRDGVHQVEVSDLMRRLVKEIFDKTPLFPRRWLIPFRTGSPDAEARPSKEVTDYVRTELLHRGRSGRDLGEARGAWSSTPSARLWLRHDPTMTRSNAGELPHHVTLGT